MHLCLKVDVIFLCLIVVSFIFSPPRLLRSDSAVAKVMCSDIMLRI